LHIAIGTPGWDEVNPQTDGRGTLVADQKTLLQDKLIEKPEQSKYYGVTAKGDHLVTMLKQTPQPVSRWGDPREVE